MDTPVIAIIPTMAAVLAAPSPGVDSSLAGGTAGSRTQPKGCTKCDVAIILIYYHNEPSHVNAAESMEIAIYKHMITKQQP